MSLGLVNNNNREIYQGNDYDYLFPSPKNKSVIVHETDDITTVVDYIKQIVSETLDQTEKIAPKLKGKNNYETVKNIWSFCKDMFNYATEEQEQLREPARAYADRFSGIDCDCYTIFTSSILTNLGIKHYYRLAKYNLDQYQHIYIIVPDDNQTKGYITLDCVKDAFNLEHPYKSKPLDIMALEVSRLSGINSMNITPRNAQIVRGYHGTETDGSKKDSTEESEKEEKKESVFSNPLVWVVIIAVGLLLSWKMGLFGGGKSTKGTSGLGATASKTEQRLRKELQAWEEKEKKRKENDRLRAIKADADKRVAAANARARAKKA